MKKIFFLLIAAAALALCACSKEDDPVINPNDTIVDPGDHPGDHQNIAGEYDMTITYDSVCAQGTWFPNGYMNLNYPDEHGRMTVTDLGGDSIRLEGITVFSNSSEAVTTSTTAIKNPDGTYTARPGSHQLENVSYSDTFRTIVFESDSLMRFQVVSNFVMYSYNMGFLRTITCIKNK